MSLFLCFYLGGMTCMIGVILSGMARDKDLSSADVFEYLYAALGCLLWPAFVIQMMLTEDQ
jgi:uncharacterized membrane protein